MLRDIVFDFDGTIADSKGLSIVLMNDQADKYSFRRVDDPAEITRINHMPIRERMRHVGLAPWQLPFVIRDVKRALAQRIQEVQPFDGMRELFLRLRDDGYRLAIITSNDEANVERFLAVHDLRLFHRIHAEKNLFGKAKVFRHYLKREGLRPDDVLYVGDEQRDIAACREVGIAVVAVTWGFDPEALLTMLQPDYVARHPQDIYDVVKKQATLPI